MGKPTIEDRLAINDLFIRYMTALDNGDVEGIVSCFTEDGALESPAIGKAVGIQAVREFAVRFSNFHAKGSQLRHIMSNLAVDQNGDEAIATCYLLNVLTQDGKSEVKSPGQYRCHVVKQDGEWLFKHRLVTLDSPMELRGI